MATQNKKSPRAPSFGLEESLANALKLYAEAQRSYVSSDVAAKILGYSGANNGSAARSLATMKSFGLLLSDNKGDVAIAPEVEEYRYAPNDSHRKDQLKRWLSTPKVYQELLTEYPDSLPSDQVVTYRLIKMGFLPNGAQECLRHFRAAVEFANYYDTFGRANQELSEHAAKTSAQSRENSEKISETAPIPPPPLVRAESDSRILQQQRNFAAADTPSNSADRIPVRLSGGRRAWIEVPSPLFTADKQILKNQIDLIMADDEFE